MESLLFDGMPKPDSTLGRPLQGVRVLAIEQMQAMPVATQLMVRLGAEVIKVEPPLTGESGRQAMPGIIDKSGQSAGFTFLKYNLGKRSIGINLKSERGRDLILAMTPHFDVVCENLGPHRAERLGIGYEALDAVNPRVIVASITGFGKTGDSPYAEWPAYNAIPEAMTGIDEYSRLPNQPPVLRPLGAVGDTSTGLFALIGILAALRHRDLMGRGQFVDISMFDSMIAMCDVVPNTWSLGLRPELAVERRSAQILTSFRASDGWFLITVLRRHQFERLARVLGREEWLTDPRFDDRWNWGEHLESTIRPAIEGWAASRTKLEASRILAEAGIAAAPGNTAVEMINDPHVKARHMLVEIPRTDGVDEPVLVAGNPVKMSLVPELSDGEFPIVGEHTDEILREVLELDVRTIAGLRDDGVIA